MGTQLETKSLDELVTLLNKEWPAFERCTPEPKEYLPDALLTRIKEQIDKRYVGDLGGQFLFDCDGGFIESKTHMICHAFYAYDSDWDENNTISVYYSNHKYAKNREDVSTYLKWLSEESPYANFFLAQKDYSDGFLFARHDYSKYISRDYGGAFSMGRRFSERCYPCQNWVDSLKEQIPIDPFLLLLYSQLWWYDTPEEAGELSPITGHTLFSFPNFTRKSFFNYLRGQYARKNQTGSYYAPMWGDSLYSGSRELQYENRNSLLREFMDIRDSVRNGGRPEVKEVYSAPNPFGQAVEEKLDYRFTVEEARKSFIILILKTIRGEYN
jgi:hypothetical protein